MTQVGQRPPAIATDTSASVGGNTSLLTTRVPPDDMHAVSFKDVLGKRPIALRVYVISSRRAIAESFPDRRGIRSIGANEAELLQRLTTGRSLFFRRTQRLKSLDSRLHHIDLVVTAVILTQDIVDAGGLDHGTHCPSGDDAGTGSGWFQHHPARAKFDVDAMRNAGSRHGNADQVLFGLFHALADRLGNLSRLAHPGSDHRVVRARPRDRVRPTPIFVRVRDRDGELSAVQQPHRYAGGGATVRVPDPVRLVAFARSRPWLPATVRVADGLTVSVRIAAVSTLVTLTVCATIASSAQEPKPAVEQSKPAAGAAAADDNMTPYRKLAADTLTAFKAHDMPAAKKKARELEVAWDTREKALQKKSPDLWGQIDKAMDAFIKPMQGKSPDPAKVQTAYDAFIAKLQLAVTSDAEPKR